MKNLQALSARLAMSVVAHQDARGCLLLFEFVVSEEPSSKAETASAQVAVVIDRSGSMQGNKIRCATDATSKLIRSLRPQDRIGVVAYDDRIWPISPLGPPSERMARDVEQLTSRGSTNLYEGWLFGAKMAGEGGRVILLSDGLANAGRYRSASELADQAGRSFTKYRVTTSTVGIGRDYDEALMAGMARHGGGAHYFADDPESIVRAFSEERFAIDAEAVSHVSLNVGGEIVQVGHLWTGQSKRLAVQIRSLSTPVSVRFTDRETEKTETVQVELPTEFGKYDEATLQLLVQTASELQDRAGNVRGTEEAAELKGEMKGHLLALLNHPLASEPIAVAARQSLEQTMDRLETLSIRYEEHLGSFSRKQARQHAHNLSDPARAYLEDTDVLSTTSFMRCSFLRDSDQADVEPSAAVLYPVMDWFTLGAVPLRINGNTLIVASSRPKDGFLIKEIGDKTGLRVRIPMVVMDGPELLVALEKLRLLHESLGNR